MHQACTVLGSAIQRGRLPLLLAKPAAAASMQRGILAQRRRSSSSSSTPAVHRRPRRLLTIASAAPSEAARFDPEDPVAFYLPGCADMTALADARPVVEGRRLPVHSQVLSLHSRALRGSLADLRRMGSEGKAVLAVMKAPFQGLTLFDAALFLRLCYQPRELSSANLAAAPGSLPGLLRLAHELDAPQIQQAVSEAMADNLHSATLPQLLEWVAAAGHCQLPELRLRCISEVASSLASGPGSAFADAALVAERCDRSVLAQLLGLLGAAAAVNRLSSPEAIAEALHRAANSGSCSLQWALERFSEQPSAVGSTTCSPWFSVGGKEWRFEVHPGGDKKAAAGHLSAYLRCKQPGTRATFALTLADQAAEGAEDITRSPDAPKLFDGHGWGWRRFASHARLRSRPGYLAGDRLVLRATVEVV